jgi:outer membrane protein TolC
MTSRSARDLRFDSRCVGVAVAIVLCSPFTAGAQTNDVPLRVSPDSAVSLALANNLNLESARRSPEIAAFNLRAAESVWRPSIVATLGQGRADSPANTSFDRTLDVLTHRDVTSDVSVSQLLPWGASYDIGWSSSRRVDNSVLNRFQPELNSAATASVTQPLLRGFAIDAARADRARSLHERDRAEIALDGTVATLKREVLYAYWQWVYTRELRAVAAEARALAQALLDGNRERVAARAMAATDVIEAEAEVSRRDEAVIIAEKNVANAEDRLRLLILNPRGQDYFRPLEPTGIADSDTTTVAAIDAVTRALAQRSDLEILRSTLETDSLNVRQLKNETLPDINVSAGFSARAVGGTELVREAGIGTPVVGSLERGFGPVLGDLGQLRYPGWSIQVSVGYPVGAVVAKANAARAQVEQRQDELALAALEQRIATEVRTAQREVEANEKRLESTAMAVTLAERRLAAEEEKFLVGLSTSFFVFQAQRDLASARVARLGAVLDRRLSIADLEAVQTAPLTPIR